VLTLLDIDNYRKTVVTSFVNRRQTARGWYASQHSCEFCYIRELKTELELNYIKYLPIYLLINDIFGILIIDMKLFGFSVISDILLQWDFIYQYFFHK
jgi:hypothetical protein